MVKGIGKSRFPLVAFDHALREAGIGDYNLVKISSIIPANCIRATEIDIKKGSILYTAYSALTVSCGENGYVGVAIALPSSHDDNGVIFECSENYDPTNRLRKMCEEAMSERGKEILDFQVAIQEVTGDRDCCTTAIAAVALW